MEQEAKIPSKDKFRRMMCLTFLSTGSCPFDDRCVFLHDDRFKNVAFPTKSVKAVKGKAKNTKDTFYWPDMQVFHTINYFSLTIYKIYHQIKLAASCKQENRSSWSPRCEPAI